MTSRESLDIIKKFTGDVRAHSMHYADQLVALHKQAMEEVDEKDAGALCCTMFMVLARIVQLLGGSLADMIMEASKEEKGGEDEDDGAATEPPTDQT